MNNSSGQGSSETNITSNAAIKLRSSNLLMTCQVIESSFDGKSTQASAVLDTGSTLVSFVSECRAMSTQSQKVLSNYPNLRHSPGSHTRARVGVCIFSNYKIQLDSGCVAKGHSCSSHVTHAI